MTIEIRYRVNEATIDTCNYGINFLDKNLEKIVERANKKTGERTILYKMKDGKHIRTIAALESYARDSRKEDYPFYVLINGTLRDFDQNEALKSFKRSLDTAVGKNGKLTELPFLREKPAKDRRKTPPSKDRRQSPRTVNQIFSGNFSLDVQNLLVEYNSGAVENLTERMNAIKSYYAPKPQSKTKSFNSLKGFVEGFLGFLLLP